MSAPPATRPPRGNELHSILEGVSEQARGGVFPVVLFDLDDTVLSTGRRHARILREFCAEPEVSQRWPEEVRRLCGFAPPPAAYAVTDIARAAGVSRDETLAALRAFWFSRFFRSDYVLEDAAVPGAPEFCRLVAAAGGRVVYLTGRDEAMRPGTEQSLARNGFPIPGEGDTRLILKPRFDAPDLEFKNEALDRVATWGPVAAGFENEPAHINLFYDRFPAGRMVLVETKHSGKPVAPYAGVGRIRDFRLTF